MLHREIGLSQRLFSNHGPSWIHSTWALAVAPLRDDGCVGASPPAGNSRYGRGVDQARRQGRPDLPSRLLGRRDLSWGWLLGFFLSSCCNLRNPQSPAMADPSHPRGQRKHGGLNPGALSTPSSGTGVNHLLIEAPCP